MPIVNRDQYPEVEFLSPTKYRQIGTWGKRPLYLIGQGISPLVAPCGVNPQNADLEVVYLHEIAKFDPMGLQLTEDIEI